MNWLASIITTSACTTLQGFVSRGATKINSQLDGSKCVCQGLLRVLCALCSVLCDCFSNLNPNL